MSPWAIGVLYLLASALTASSSFSTSTPWTAQASATVSPRLLGQRPQAANKMKSFFQGHVPWKNSLRGASVELCAYGAQPRRRAKRNPSHGDDDRLRLSGPQDGQAVPQAEVDPVRHAIPGGGALKKDAKHLF